MKSAVPHTPMATLGAVAPSGPAAVAGGRAPQGPPADGIGVSTIVIAGAPCCGKSSVTNALLGAPALAPTDDPTAADRAVTSAYLSFTHADAPSAYAYVPGRRAPRPLSLEQVRAGDAAAFLRGGPRRPPRRVEVLHPAALLRQVGLVDTPGAGGFDQAYTDVVLDTLRGGALLFVSEASTALQPAQLDFLAQVEQRGVPVTFVLAKIDIYPQWPAVLSVNQRLVHEHAPGLATAPWYAVSTLRGCDGAPPAAAEEAARGLAGLGIGALRRALTEPAPGEPARPVVPRPRTGPVPGERPVGQSTTPAPRVAEGVTDARWTETLDREIRSRGTAAGQALAGDLAAILARCEQETDCARLAYVVDRELHALSVRATRAVEEGATAIMRQVFTEILQTPPDQAALERIRGAARRAVDAAESGAPDWDRVLLVTSTSAIAVTAGQGALASLAAVASRPVSGELLPPIGVGLSAACYAVRHSDDDRRRCRDWLRQTIDALEVQLGGELARRFEYLREALTVVAADTVDHGVLLA